MFQLIVYVVCICIDPVFLNRVCQWKPFGMTLDERQREITIKSKKGTSAGFQVSELLEANTITMLYNTLKYKYTYNTIQL